MIDMQASGYGRYGTTILTVQYSSRCSMLWCNSRPDPGVMQWQATYMY